MSKKLILASTSKYRQALLNRVGIAAECVRPDYDESPVEGLKPAELVAYHAKHKALAVAQKRTGSDALVIGSDQGLVFGETLIGKPGTVERAVAQLMQFAGKQCELVTALYVYDIGTQKEWTHTDVTVLKFASLDESTIRTYVAWDMPLDCAGSFKIESRGPELFDAVVTQDPTAIEGLPLMALCRILRTIS